MSRVACVLLSVVVLSAVIDTASSARLLDRISKTKRISQSALDAECGVYADAKSMSLVGNGDVKYDVIWIAKSDLSEPGKYMMKSEDADVSFTKPTACAFHKMRTAAKAAGVDLKISSAFRTIPRQRYLRNCYEQGLAKGRENACNGGALAAKVGKSNHGKGQALDLNTGCGEQGKTDPHVPNACKNSKVYMFLHSHAAEFGFKRTVHREPWHWELRPNEKAEDWASFAPGPAPAAKSKAKAKAKAKFL